jgi:CHAT domain-containing protein
MTRDSSGCPDPEVLAAFVAGNLRGAELKMMADHLRGCDDCRIIVAENARAEREQAEEPVPRTAPVAARTSPRVSPWWLAAAAAALIGIAYLALVRLRASANGEIRTLVEAAPRDGRYIEPRVTGGFPWAPLRASRRSGAAPLDAGHMQLIGAAGRVLDQTADDPSPRAQHASALAHLLAGRPDEAGALLAKTVRSVPDAAMWSDLSAARYVTAEETQNPSHLAEALAAADAALRVDPDLPEALFNRALIVERLGLGSQARAAWDRYLAVDRVSPWAAEAKQHLARLAPAASFRDLLERGYEQLASNSAVAVALARRYPQEARIWGETEILGRWAEARKKGDAVRADAHLRLARAFAGQLARSGGDAMLRGAVAAIDRGDESDRDTLAEAHLRFREAQRTYRTGGPAAAESLFVAAAEGFRQAGSPVELLARYFAANTQYDQGRIADARDRLESLHAHAPAELPAYRAQLEWQLGLVHASMGAWGKAMNALGHSIATFERLGEVRYANSVREILAEVYDRIGDPRAAWRDRILVLQALGHSDDSKLLVTLDSAARAAALDRNWPVALSLLGLQLEMAERNSDDLLTAETLMLRARIEAKRNRPGAARTDLLAAARAISRLTDATYRARAEADRLTVEGYLATSPADAIPLFARAIEFNRRSGRRMLLPDLHLQRARALHAAGDQAAAAVELDEGIRELEAQRSSIAPGEQRWGMFAAAHELFDDAVSLAIARGDTRGAFLYSERGRARTLLESVAASPASALDARDAVLVEYASLPAGLVIFVVADGRVQVAQQSITRDALASEVEEFVLSVLGGDDAQFRHGATALYSHLIVPVAAALPPERPLVVIPDATLRGVPFAALLDAQGRFLVEQHPLSVAPSAAVYAQLARRSVSAGSGVLIIEGPGAIAGDPGRLRASTREATSVASMYERAVRITAKEADDAAFANRAVAARVIHFVGHAVSDERRHAALITAAGADSDGRLNVTEISMMRLPQTRVVVLAACSTAAGEERPGEGNISVARAFLTAGVPSVVATLWPIEDEPAAQFFPELHHYLARGVAPAQALRLAQLESIHGRRAPPAMWAAVQVIGS